MPSEEGIFTCSTAHCFEKQYLFLLCLSSLSLTALYHSKIDLWVVKQCSRSAASCILLPHSINAVHKLMELMAVVMFSAGYSNHSHVSNCIFKCSNLTCMFSFWRSEVSYFEIIISYTVWSFQMSPSSIIRPFWEFGQSIQPWYILSWSDGLGIGVTLISVSTTFSTY